MNKDLRFDGRVAIVTGVRAPLAMQERILRSSWDGFLFLGVVTRAGASIIVVGFNHCDRQVYLLRQISIVPRNRTYSSSNGVFILQDR